MGDAVGQRGVATTGATARTGATAPTLKACAGAASSETRIRMVDRMAFADAGAEPEDPRPQPSFVPRTRVTHARPFIHAPSTKKNIIHAVVSYSHEMSTSVSIVYVHA